MENRVLTRPSTEPQLALVSRLLHGGAWVVVSRVSGIGLTFLSNVLLARWLSPRDFGQFLLLVSVIGILCILARFGVDRVLIRFVSEGLVKHDAKLVIRTLRISLTVGLASSICVALLAVAIPGSLHRFFNVPIQVLMLTGCAVPVFTMLYLIAESLRGFHELRYASIFQPHSGPLTTLLFLGALVVIPIPISLTIALTCYVLSAALILPIGLICLMRTVNRRLPAQSNMSQADSNPLVLSHVLSVCTPIAISDTLVFLTMNAGLWIVAICCTADDLALFGAARQLAMLAALPLNLINMTVISSIPELHAAGRLNRLQRVLQISATVATIPTLLMVLMFAIAPMPILEVVFGAFYRDAAWILVILSIAQLVSTWTGSSVNVLLLTGWQTLVARLNVVSIVLLLALGPVSGLNYGATGVAVISAAIIAEFNLVAWIAARIQVGIWTHATVWLRRDNALSD